MLVDQHPVSKVGELTPRNWKVLFADNHIGIYLSS